uniref:SAP domain-containing protein n=1 Tax=Heterorhabditis bacteriophora TaxID=37862 RepID=A0A1I7WSW6_HETBA
MLNEVRLPSGKLVSSLKVKELQKELNKRRLSSIGKKSELASRLVEFLSSTEQLIPGEHSQHCRSEVSKEQSSENINSEDINSTFNKSGESAGNEINSWTNETFEIIERDSNEAENLEGNSIRTPKRESFISKLDIKSRKSSRKSRINVLDMPYAESNALNERGRRSNTPKSSRKSIQEHSPQQLHHSFISYDGAEEENNPIKVYNLEEKDVIIDIGSTNGVRRRTEDVRRSILRELGWDDNLRPVIEPNIFLSPDLNNTSTREGG